MQSVRVVSYKSSGGALPAASTIADAIATAVDNLQFGDVLLLETQMPDFTPCETDLSCFDAIRLASALGVVVIEPAGNGAAGAIQNLDNFTDAAGNHVLFRDPVNPNPAFKDSVAIMVAAGSSVEPHTHRANSNFGHRVDCYAWGDGVFTAVSNNAIDTASYSPPFFPNTSAAAAIIAGAALSVQGMLQASQGRRFSPRQLQLILSDPNNGTPATGANSSLMGVMPDLGTIATTVLNVVPDLLVRDFVGDAGVAGSGVGAASPDIILRAVLVADPQAAFGAGSGTENSTTLSDPVQAGQDNYLYVRLLNCGGTAATNVNVTVYWSPGASLITPHMWTPVGTTVVSTVPVGMLLTVSNAIVWPAAKVPPPGHYCFIALVDHPADPAPPLVKLKHWKNFVRFVGANNNVGWRNFNVVSSVPEDEALDPAVALDFIVSGAPDRARPMRLEIVAHLPARGGVALEAPLALIDAWGVSPPLVKMADGRGVIKANPNGSFLLPEYAFPARSRMPVRLWVHVPEEMRRHAYEVFARQIYQGAEVGRITWRLQRSTRSGRFEVDRTPH